MLRRGVLIVIFEKKRILFILPSLNGGGAERVTCNLMNNLSRNHFEIGLFLYTKKGDYFDLLAPDISVYYVREDGCANKLEILKKLIEVSQDYDVLFGAMELMPTYLASVAAFINNKKSVGWVHINMDMMLQRKKYISGRLHKYFLIPFFYSFISKIIVVSKGAGISFRKYLLQNTREKIVSLYNPIDFDMILRKGNEYIKNTFGTPLLIAVGRLEEQKNYPLMLDAFKLLLNDYHDAKLIILGKGILENYLQNLVIKAGMSDAVIFLGYKENPYKYIKMSDIFVLSSHFEGLPTVLIEAVALGTKVVSVNCPDGVSEIIDNEEIGTVVENYNAKKLCNAIKYELGRSVQKKNTLHESCKRFSYTETIPKFEKVLIEI